MIQHQVAYFSEICGDLISADIPIGIACTPAAYSTAGNENGESGSGRVGKRDERGDENDTMEAVHLATLAEKKRRWWRNAFINTIFIASWCVSGTLTQSMRS